MSGGDAADDANKHTDDSAVLSFVHNCVDAPATHPRPAIAKGVVGVEQGAGYDPAMSASSIADVEAGAGERSDTTRSGVVLAMTTPSPVTVMGLGVGAETISRGSAGNLNTSTAGGVLGLAEPCPQGAGDRGEVVGAKLKPCGSTETKSHLDKGSRQHNQQPDIPSQPNQPLTTHTATLTRPPVSGLVPLQNTGSKANPKQPASATGGGRGRAAAGRGRMTNPQSRRAPAGSPGLSSGSKEKEDEVVEKAQTETSPNE